MPAIINDKFVQLTGPFEIRQDLIPIIRKQCSDFHFVTRLGISAVDGDMVSINGEVFEIGKTGMFEVKNINISSIYFLKDMPETTIVDCVLD